MTKDEVLKLALEALECALSDHRPYIVQCKEAITAIKKALAQLEQEPVSYTGNGTAGREADVRPTAFFFQMPKTEQEPVAHWSDCAVHSEPAYPKGECDCGGFPPQRTWVGLTDEEINTAASVQSWKPFAKAIEAKLKEKNT